MQFKRLVMASVCALALQGAAFAQAADDVYVEQFAAGRFAVRGNPAPVSGG